MAMTLKRHLLPEKEYEKLVDDEEKRREEEKKKKKMKKRVFVIDFDGDIAASGISSLREEITAILSVATPDDEIVVRLESGGGLVTSYGLGASQLKRIKEKNIPLTVTVDRIAASGGYMMACIADRIVAAPFAIVGSIGVVVEAPNFHRLLKKHDIDYEVITAGEYKRTITMFGRNTEKGKEKLVEQLKETHQLFKKLITDHRQDIQIDKISTGELLVCNPSPGNEPCRRIEDQRRSPLIHERKFRYI